MHIHYRPAAHVLDRLEKVAFVAVVGPTAVGKTTLIKAAVTEDPELHMLVSGVSRAPRPSEQDGIDFHFGDKAAMEARVKAGEYATVVLGVSGDLYTTAPEDYPAGKTVLMATLASAIPTFRALPFKHFYTVFILPPSFEVWLERLEHHAFTPVQLAYRLAEAKASLQFALHQEDIVFVMNDALPRATEDLCALARGKMPASGNQRSARDLVRMLLDRLQ